jgi:hypothetical protein
VCSPIQRFPQMKSRVIIIGAGGRLGAALVREYQEKFHMLGFNHAQRTETNLRHRLTRINTDRIEAGCVDPRGGIRFRRMSHRYDADATPKDFVRAPCLSVFRLCLSVANSSSRAQRELC